MLRSIVCLVLSFGFAGGGFARKFEDLAPTPPMGWNTWNTFASNTNEALIRETADEMIRNGRKDAGATGQPFRKRLDCRDVALLRLRPAQ